MKRPENASCLSFPSFLPWHTALFIPSRSATLITSDFLNVCAYYLFLFVKKEFFIFHFDKDHPHKIRTYNLIEQTVSLRHHLRTESHIRNLERNSKVDYKHISVLSGELLWIYVGKHLSSVHAYPQNQNQKWNECRHTTPMYANIMFWRTVKRDGMSKTWRYNVCIMNLLKWHWSTNFKSSNRQIFPLLSIFCLIESQ